MRQDSWLFFLEFFLLLYLCFAGLLSFSLCFFLFSVWTTTTTGTSATGRNGRISVPDGHWWTRERRQNNVKNSNNTLKQGAKVDVKTRDTVTNRNTGEEVNKGNESQRRFPFIWRMTPDFIITLIFSCCPIAYPILSPVHYIVRHMWNTKVPLCLLVCYDYILIIEKETRFSIFVTICIFIPANAVNPHFNVFTGISPLKKENKRKNKQKNSQEKYGWESGTFFDVEKEIHPAYPWICAFQLVSLLATHPASCHRRQDMKKTVYTWCITSIDYYLHRPTWIEYVQNCQIVYWSSCYPPPRIPLSQTNLIQYIQYIYIFSYHHHTIYESDYYYRKYLKVSCCIVLKFCVPLYKYTTEKKNAYKNKGQKKKKKRQNIEKMTKNKNKIPKYAYSPWCFSFPFFLTPVSSSKLFVSISRSTLASSFYCPVYFFFLHLDDVQVCMCVCVCVCVKRRNERDRSWNMERGDFQ